MAASMDVGTLSCNHNELNSANDLVKLESRLSPRASRKEYSPADTMVQSFFVKKCIFIVESTGITDGSRALDGEGMHHFCADAFSQG